MFCITRVRNILAQLHQKDITSDEKQELHEALEREVVIHFVTCHKTSSLTQKWLLKVVCQLLNYQICDWILVRIKFLSLVLILTRCRHLQELSAQDAIDVIDTMRRNLRRLFHMSRRDSKSSCVFQFDIG